MTIKIEFHHGLLLCSGQSLDRLMGAVELGLTYDARIEKVVAPARFYKEIVLACQKLALPLTDLARAYDRECFTIKKEIIPRTHQAEALEAWENEGRRGVVILPTGSGKSILGVMAIARVQRPSLVVVPTIDLVFQWQKTLSDFFQEEIGVYGGGQKTLNRITVATYDSARLIVEGKGNRFGLIVFDECHHLPAPGNRIIAEASISPFRLGLTATMERTDAGEEFVYEAVGREVYKGSISKMVSGVLAPYDVVNVEVPLTDQEWQRYSAARSTYVNFLRRSGVQIGSPGGWQKFIQQASRTPQGRLALQAYREQKILCNASSAKIGAVWKILSHHPDERMILFTHDNAMAYRIGREFLLPVITHHSKAAERKELLDAFRAGKLSVLVTSRVLNEGVDVPEASVGVVVSGSGSVREHVQRLGRILRHKPGKRACLYEIVARDTAEKFVNDRRRQHDAYQGSR